MVSQPRQTAASNSSCFLPILSSSFFSPETPLSFPEDSHGQRPLEQDELSQHELSQHLSQQSHQASAGTQASETRQTPPRPPLPPRPLPVSHPILAASGPEMSEPAAYSSEAEVADPPISAVNPPASYIPAANLPAANLLAAQSPVAQIPAAQIPVAQIPAEQIPEMIAPPAIVPGWDNLAEASGLQRSRQEQPEFVIPLHNDEYLPALSRWTTWGGLLLLTAMGAATGLAAVTPSPVLVRAGAMVRPQGELKVVQAIADGTIQAITVEEGQGIHRGQPIARLDDTQLKTRQRQLEISIQQGQIQIQQLQAQMATLDSQRLAEQNLLERTLASARAELVRVQREHADRKAIAQKDVQESEALMAAAQAEYQAYEKAAAVGVLPRVQADSKRQAYKAAQARLERAQTTLNPSDAGITIAEETIAQTRAQGQSTLANLQRQREALGQQQSQIRQQIEQDQQTLAQVMQEFDKTIIRSQVDGSLLKLNLRNEGQVVRAGDVIAQVFPEDAPIEIKAKVSPQDIGQVQVGQRVNMRVSAYSYTDYGTLEGVVTAVTADAIAPQSPADSPNLGSAMPYFEVTIQPKQDFLSKGEERFEIVPGMEVQADIVAREETVLTLVLRKARLLTNL